MSATIGIVIGPKGRGSNMAAIIDACASGELAAKVGVVVSPLGDIPAVQNALAKDIRVEVVPPGTDEYGRELLRALKDCEVVCLAGYLRLLPLEVLERFPNRILNIHPALLPKFGGKGMYGRRVHEAVLEAGEEESGCTVHYVSAQYDEGAIILQRRVPVEPDDTPETLAARVLVEEHRAYVEALRKVIDALRN